MTNEELQSKTISFLRFPLIVGVVLIHSQFKEVVFNGVNLMKDGSFPVYTNVSYLFSVILPQITVPLFYFMSGFLFFYKVIFLVPYLLWNLLVIALYFLSQTLLLGLTSGNQKLIINYTFFDWLWAFWNTGRINHIADAAGYPICFQLWFIRDLMVVMLFSPLVYFLLKKLGIYAVMALGILWVFNLWFTIVGFSITAFFFFSSGAYFSIHGKNFVGIMKPFLLPSALCFTVLASIQLGFREEVWCSYIYYINVIVGIVLAITLSAYFIEKGKWRVNSFLSDSSFFIYAYHAMVLALVLKSLFKVFRPHTDAAVLIIYLVCPTMVIGIGLVLYYFLRKYWPKTTALITGGR